MNRVLLSWYATKNDFIDKTTKVAKEGTTFSFHKYFYKNYKKHIILSSKSFKNGDTKLDFLANELAREFPEHMVESKYMNISDVIDLEQIIAKVSQLLAEFKNSPVDIFISPGTPTMQTAWILAHVNLPFNTQLLQVRPKEFTKDRKKPELIPLVITKETITSSIIIKQALNEKISIEASSQGFLYTESIEPIFEFAKKAAQARNAKVLIYGETGTGKERLARYIHQNSPRRKEKFIPINCSALSDGLLESRLFGYKRGSFTGATEDKTGILEEADGGTVFLDEIGDISPKLQQSLLRVLQENEILPIGGNDTVKIDVRFIAATNKDLLQECEKGNFRWDLYYRLAIVDLELPSLRERGITEIKELINFFLKSKKKDFNPKHALQISKEIMNKILSYPFPGNVRELEALIERLYIMTVDGQVQLKDLPKRILYPSQSHSLLLKDIERLHIEKVLRQNGGNKAKTARDLGIVVNTLKKKIEEYQIGT